MKKDLIAMLEEQEGTGHWKITEKTYQAEGPAGAASLSEGPMAGCGWTQ